MELLHRIVKKFVKFTHLITVPYEVKVQTEALRHAQKRLKEIDPKGGRGGGILTSSQIQLLSYCLAEGLTEKKGEVRHVSNISRYFNIKQPGIRNAAQRLSFIWGLIEYDSVAGKIKLTKRGKTLSHAIFSPIISLEWILGFLAILILLLFLYVYLPGLLFVATGSITGYSQLFMWMLLAVIVAYVCWFFIPATLSLWWRKRLIDKAIIK